MVIVQQMRPTTLQKCLNAVLLVYEKGHSLHSAAKEVKLSSQTLYTYVDERMSMAEQALIRSISQQNANRQA